MRVRVERFCAGYIHVPFPAVEDLEGQYGALAGDAAGVLRAAHPGRGAHVALQGKCSAVECNAGALTSQAGTI